MTAREFPAIFPSKTGFTLVEMAIVLFIVAILLGGLLPTLSGQVEQRQNNETRKQLDEIKEALIGFAVANGRLPCPASNTSNGAEDPPTAASGVPCTQPYAGYVPAATLGFNGATNNQGLIMDSWGNPIHYAVSSRNTSPVVNNAFTTTSGMSNVGIVNLAPNLQVCSTATSITGTNCATGARLTPNGTPAVIYSTGKNGGYGGTGKDESENPNPNSTISNPVFVSHLPTPSSAPNGEFDDIVIWLSTNVLVNRMVAAGQLP